MATRTKILIVGATGFTGRHVIEELSAKKEQYEVTAMIRDIEKAQRLKLSDAKITICQGSLEDSDILQKELEKADVFICCASLGFGHTPKLVECCEKSKIGRSIFISTTGIFTKLNPSSKKIRLEAENLIQESGLDYIIVRPTMIFGTSGDRNISRLIKYIKKWPILPIAGSGENLIQPVFVKDLAKAIVCCVELKEPKIREFNISGGTAVSFNESVRTIARILHKKIICIHIPLIFMIWLFRFYGRMVKKPKLKVEQILRMNEDKAFDHIAAVDAFGYSPISLEAALQYQMKEMGY